MQVFTKIRDALKSIGPWGWIKGNYERKDRSSRCMVGWIRWAMDLRDPSINEETIAEYHAAYARCNAAMVNLLGPKLGLEPGMGVDTTQINDDSRTTFDDIMLVLDALAAEEQPVPRYPEPQPEPTPPPEPLPGIDFPEIESVPVDEPLVEERELVLV